MPFKPFPLALNIGTDIVHLARISRLVAHRPSYRDRFTRRVLCETEREDFRARFSIDSAIRVPNAPVNDVNGNTNLRKAGSQHPNASTVSPDMIRWLAGRFAAKEAAKKAAPFGAAGMGWKDVLVRVPTDSRSHDRDASGTSGSGRPEIVYLEHADGNEVGVPSAGGQIQGGLRGRIGRLSISHDGDYVVATVLAAG